MFTSRAEFRLHLRIDNADRRLTPHGRRVGLISDEAWADFQAKEDRQEKLKKLLESTKLTPRMLESIQHSALSIQSEEPSLAVGRWSPAKPRQTNDSDVATSAPEVKQADLSLALGQPLAQLLKRPEVTIEHLVPILRELIPNFFTSVAKAGDVEEPVSARVNSCPSRIPSAVRNELKSVETEIKYEGYLQQQERAIERLKRAEQRHIPEWFDYHSVSGLSREMQEKLVKIRPRTLGHASRIPGVTPAAVSLVNVYIEIQARRREQAAVI